MKLWQKILAVLAAIGAALAGAFMLFNSRKAKLANEKLAEENARRAREQAETAVHEAARIAQEKVSVADAKAAQEVVDAKRTGGLADHLRSDGAGR